MIDIDRESKYDNNNLAGRIRVERLAQIQVLNNRTLEYEVMRQIHNRREYEENEELISYL